MSIDANHSPRAQQRRVPLVSALLLAAAVTLLLFRSFGVLPNPCISGGIRLALFLLPLPPLLAFGGAFAALRDRRVSQRGRIFWAVGAALFGVICLPTLFVLITLKAGP
jgi:hypothetical protein